MTQAKFFILITLWLIPFIDAQGQSNDSLPVQLLDTIIISSTRLSSLPSDLPISVTSITPKSIATTQQLSLKEQLLAVAGLYSQNAYNYAQDLRISIRGFGSRSAFGINGLKIMVDGVPETTPDGQGQLDNLNIGQISRLEIIKSASSALYGNASGGVIQITTEQAFEKNYLDLNTTLGSYNFSSYALSGGLALPKTKITGLARYMDYGGYRKHSRLQQFNSALRVIHNFSEGVQVSFFAELMNSPIADDPGGLTLDEARDEPKMARQANLDFDAGETVQQYKIGSRLSWSLNPNATCNAYFFYNHRDFDGKLPFEFGGIIDLKRNYFGQGSDFELNSGNNRLKIGYDALFQNDDRRRYENLQGEQGLLTFHQEEIFNNLGIYALDHLNLGRFRLNGGLRFDLNKIEAIDLNQQTGDNSSVIYLRNLSPTFGLGYELTQKVFLFSNYSFGFKTPTLNQLSNRPDGDEGFNELQPQLANNYELGLKGNGKFYQAEIALFYIKTKDDLVPYELAALPNRTFFRNVGETNRLGTETSLSFFFKFFSVTGSYTFSNFQYNNVIIEDEDLTGNLLPGIPKHFGNLQLQYAKNGLEGSLNINYSGNLFADDQNLTRVDEYLLANLKLSYTWELEHLLLQPYLGINNLFNTQYFDNIRINAFGQRYYEPAPGFNWYWGMRIKLN